MPCGGSTSDDVDDDLEAERHEGDAAGEHGGVAVRADFAEIATAGNAGCEPLWVLQESERGARGTRTEISPEV